MNIVFKDKEDVSFRTYLKEQIKSFNNEISPLHLASRKEGYVKYIQFEVIHEGVCIGGLTGRIYWSCLEIDDIFIESSFRKLGYGKRLIMQAQAYAKSIGLHFIFLKTFSFQAKPFYEKYGFYVIGEIKGYPETASLYTMRYDIQ